MINEQDAMDHGTDLQQVLESCLEGLVRGQPLRETLDEIAKHVSQIACFVACWIVLVDEREGLYTGGSWGLEDYETKLGYIDTSSPEILVRSPTARALRFGEPVIIRDVMADPSFSMWRDLAVEYNYRSVMSIPLVMDDEVVGVLNGYSHLERDWTSDDVDSIRSLVHNATIAVSFAAMVGRHRNTIGELNELNAQLDRQRVMLERAAEIHTQLTRAVLEGSGFDDVTRRLADVLGRPVAVWDAAKRMTHCVPESARDVCARLTPVTGTASDRLQCEIIVGDELVGYIVTTAPDDDASELGARALQHAATVLALVIVNTRVATETEERLRSDLIHELLTSEALRRDEIAERGRPYGLRLGEPYQVIVGEVTNWERYCDTGDVSRTTAARQLVELLRRISNVICGAVPGALVTRRGDAITVLAPVTPGLPATEALESLAKRLHDERLGDFPGVSVRFGVGAACDDPHHFKRSSADAQRCLRVGRNISPDRRVTSIEELGVFAPLLDVRDPSLLTGIADRLLGPLIRHDHDKGGALMDTLRALLDNTGPLDAVAETLHVHPNTIRYRARQIEQLTGLDLRSSDHRLQLTLACAVETVRGEFPSAAAAPGAYDG
jgi:sugar diacid utilization regulator/GAF domain-containing protein